jgi:type IV pilus assembly protein PilV
MRSCGSACIRFERGLSLFEILITVVVVSIGLLGLAGLQFAGLRASNNAQDHTTATLLAQDIEARIRANPVAAQPPNLAYNSISLDSSSSPGIVDCLAASCTPSVMANFDIYQWYRFIVPAGADKPLLPNASVDINSNDGINFQITIQWGDPSGPQALNANFTTS